MPDDFFKEVLNDVKSTSTESKVVIPFSINQDNLKDLVTLIEIFLNIENRLELTQPDYDRK